MKRRKVLPLIVAVAGIALLFASVGLANVPAPPVNQDIGMPDIEFGDLAAQDCRDCHDWESIPDRHHMLYGSTIPDPSIVPNPDVDGTPGDDTNYGCLNCHNQSVVGDPPVITFMVERDCKVCHTGDSPHHETADAIAGDCVSCHGDIVDNEGDGHVIPTYAPSLVTPSPQASECEQTGNACGDDSYCTENACDVKRIPCSVDADCAGAVCEDSKNPCTDNYDCDPGYCRNDNGVPCNTDADCGSVLSCENSRNPCTTDADCDTSTGEVCENRGCSREEECLTGPDVCIIEGEHCVASDTPQPGGCNYCHDAGNDTASGLDVLDAHDTHHPIRPSTYPPSTSRCDRCHVPGDTHANDIRTCEKCHGYESLHSIQADTDSDSVVTPGQEAAGYGHVGTASGPGGDCWGCHGFAIASAPGAGTITPSITSSDVSTMSAGADTVVTLTGAAFTDAQKTSNVVLTAADGSTTTLTPDSITQGSLTVTIPGSIAAGNYNLQAVKDANTASNPVVLTVTPAVAISDIDCSKCLGVMTITGANFAEMPTGADADINVTEGGRLLDVIEWSDTEIKAAGARCRGDVTVNSVYGSSQ